MSEFIKPFAEECASLIELFGVLIIVLFAFHALAIGMIKLLKKNDFETVFREVRQQLGSGILLGLEFLVAADIIHTVVVEFTFKTVAVLGAIVLIRTFLSFALEVELTGTWPWQKKD